jgi:hypothetical protein
MGKAKLISAADARDEFTAFTGVTRLRQGQLPSGAPLEPSQTNLGSFSARAAEVASARSGLTRAATTSARVENTTAPGGEKDLPPPDRGPGSGINRSMTVPTVGGGNGGGMTRGLSLRYQNAGSESGGASTGGAAGLTRQMTQLNVRDRNEPPPPPSAARQPPRIESDIVGGRGGGGARLTEIYADYLRDDEPNVPLPTNAVDRVAQWTKKTTPGAPAPPSGTPSLVGGSSPPASGNDRLRQNIGVPLRRNSTSGSGPSNVSGSVRRRVTRRPTNAGASRAPSSYRGAQDRSTVYDEEEEEGYVSGEYEDVEYGLTKLRVKVNNTFLFFRRGTRLIF